MDDTTQRMVSIPHTDMVANLNAVAAAMWCVGNHLDDLHKGADHIWGGTDRAYDDLQNALGRGLELVELDSVFVVQEKRDGRFNDITAAVTLEDAIFAARMAAFDISRRQTSAIVDVAAEKKGFNPKDVKWGDPEVTTLFTLLLDASKQAPSHEACVAISEHPKMWVKMSKAPAGCVAMWKCTSQVFDLRIVQRPHGKGRVDLDSRPDLQTPEYRWLREQEAENADGSPPRKASDDPRKIIPQ